MRVGSQNLAFGAVNIATGFVMNIGKREYMLVAETLNCPPRPSGLSMDGQVNCVTLVSLECDVFPEDIEVSSHPSYSEPRTSSACDLSSVAIVWVRNFDIDSNIIPVIAGVYSLIQPNKFHIGSTRTFYRNAVLSALFVSATLEVRPSTEELVRAQIDGVYIFFMLLPLVTGLVCAVVAVKMKSKSQGIPTSTWDLMVLSKETDDDVVPGRQKKIEKFPEPTEDMVFIFYDAVSEVDGKSLGEASELTKLSKLKL